MEKYLYEFCTGDGYEFVFVVATSLDEGIGLARKKTKEEGEKYKFTSDDLCASIRVHDDAEIGVFDYINLRDK